MQLDQKKNIKTKIYLSLVAETRHLDWSVELSRRMQRVFHWFIRRDAFRGAPHTEELMRELVQR